MAKWKAETEKRRPRVVGFASVWALCLLGLTLFAYLSPRDDLAAFDIFPAWTWTGLALVPLVFRARAYGARTVGAWAAVGLAVTLVTTEEWQSLSRVPASPAGASIRVVTLNCASLSEAAEEVVPLKPDLVLFTENPGRTKCKPLAKTLFGDQARVAWGPDGAILGRAPLVKVDVPRGTSDFTAATTILNGQKIGLVALRLMPPEFNIELYRPDTWRSLADNRRARRREIETLAKWVAARPEVRLMAGDYNCQPWDPALAAMPPSFADAFAEAGTGWGHTAVNDYPLARIDQIWTKNWKPIRVRVQKTVNSDHRMVISEFELPAAKGRPTREGPL